MTTGGVWCVSIPCNVLWHLYSDMAGRYTRFGDSRSNLIPTIPTISPPSSYPYSPCHPAYYLDI